MNAFTHFFQMECCFTIVNGAVKPVVVELQHIQFFTSLEYYFDLQYISLLQSAGYCNINCAQEFFKAKFIMETYFVT